jgi:hypothetical protein
VKLTEVLAGKGTRWRSWLRHCATSRNLAGSIRNGVIGIFMDITHCGPGVDSASNRNEYQEYFLGDKSGRCVGPTTLTPSYADCHEIWERHPSGTLRAFPGVTLPFTFCKRVTNMATERNFDAVSNSHGGDVM